MEHWSDSLWERCLRPEAYQYFPYLRRRLHFRALLAIAKEQQSSNDIPPGFAETKAAMVQG